MLVKITFVVAISFANLSWYCCQFVSAGGLGSAGASTACATASLTYIVVLFVLGV